ncbi:hypothetical protein [Endozoicomonas arenosclerae]|uniref:hypothetical protein n=1 Tax=Endozoicomonas arenosclerae TaxID=1633495 RepID=UPI000780DCFA|nr:hypothetical protein [Endozoicomonas arenosclerae]
MSEAIKPVDTSATHQTQTNWVADSQLDNQEIYNAEKQAEKFHENLSAQSAEQRSGYVKDKQARLALLVAQKNFVI